MSHSGRTCSACAAVCNDQSIRRKRGGAAMRRRLRCLIQAARAPHVRPSAMTSRRAEVRRSGETG